MTEHRDDPNPFSREGSDPADGLASAPNRFDTGADGITPRGTWTDSPADSVSSPSAPGVDDGLGVEPSPAEEPAQSFPTYPYPDLDADHPDRGTSFQDPTTFDSRTTYENPAGYQNPGRDPYTNPVDPAYEAFQGYQANAASYQDQQLAPYSNYGSGYQSGGYGSTHYPAPFVRLPSSGYATPSLVLGIISMFSCGVTGPVGLGLGIAALRQIAAEPNRIGGRGIAIAGVVTSSLGSLFLFFFILAALMG